MDGPPCWPVDPGRPVLTFHPPNQPHNHHEQQQEYLTGQGVLEQINSGHLSPFNDGQGAF